MNERKTKLPPTSPSIYWHFTFFFPLLFPCHRSAISSSSDFTKPYANSIRHNHSKAHIPIYIPISEKRKKKLRMNQWMDEEQEGKNSNYSNDYLPLFWRLLTASTTSSLFPNDRRASSSPYPQTLTRKSILASHTSRSRTSVYRRLHFSHTRPRSS